MNGGWQALPIPPQTLGESPYWQPDDGTLVWCDIAGKALHRWQPSTATHDSWALPTEPASCAPLPGGDVLVAMRDGLFRFSPASGQRTRLEKPPYDTKLTRFNDGKADPQGRFWVSTIDEPRRPGQAALYRWTAGRPPTLQRMAGDATVGNGLAVSPDGATLYWSDTTAHRIYAFDFDGSDGSLSRQRVFAAFPPKVEGQDLATYGGRPDGAAMDAEGCYWAAMFEGSRLLRIAPDGRVLQELPLPVRCPTMPCFGGPDLRTLFVTTSREKRPAEELAAQPLAGHVLHRRVDVPGLPVHFARA